MEQNQQQPSQQTPSVAAAPPPVQPVQPVQPLPSQQDMQSAIDMDRRQRRIKTARVLGAVTALLNLIGAVATATLYALTAYNHVVTLIIATLLPVVASFFGLSAVGKSRIASSISFFGIAVAGIWYSLFGVTVLFAPLDSRPDWLMTLLFILDMIALIGGIIAFIMGVLSGIFCALAKRTGKSKGIVQLIFVCVLLAASIGVAVYALGFEPYEQEVTDNSIIWETAPVSDNALFDQSYDGEFSYSQIEQLRKDVQSGMTYQQVCDALSGDTGHIDGQSSTEERTTVYWVDSNSSFVIATFTDGRTYSIYTVTDLAEDMYNDFGQGSDTQPSGQTENPSSDSPASTATTGEQNALESAQSYLRYMAFSRNGLIDQLEYEGFTTSEATYAVDNCGADWNEQALESANSYLSHMAFSYTGLIDQLEYEGFTTEQATYAVDSCGADWNEQAAKSAESYLSHMSFSREELIDQLEYEGFTHEQAVYGAQANGY